MSLLQLLVLSPLAIMLFQAARKRSLSLLISTVACSTFLGAAGRPAGIPVPVILGGILAIAGAYASLSGRLRFRVGAIDFFLFLLCLWVLLASVVHQSGYDSIKAGLSILLIYLAGKAGRDLSAEGVQRLLLSLTISAVALAVLCFLQATLRADLWGLAEGAKGITAEGIGRVTALQGNPNGAAFYLLIGLCAAASLISNSRRAILLALCTLVPIGAAVVLTGSRSGMGAMSIVVLTTVVSRLRLKLGAALAIAVISALGALSFESVREELDDRLFPDRSMTDTGRDSRWEIGLQVMLDHPVFGFPDTYFRNERIFYHNDLLQLAADSGIPAAVAFGAALFLIARRLLRRAQSRDADPFPHFALLTLLAGVMVSSAHGVLLGGICFWLLLSIAMARTGLPGGSRLPSSKVRPMKHRSTLGHPAHT